MFQNKPYYFQKKQNKTIVYAKQFLLKLKKFTTMTTIDQNNLKTLEQKRNYALYLIINNNKRKLKKFLRKNYVTMNDLVTLKDMDMLIFLIENNASFSMIKEILKEYDNLDYTFDFKLMGKKTPLFSAIKSNRFDIADMLIEYGADINYEMEYLNILYYLDCNGLLNKENLKYIINNGFDIYNVDSYIINSLSPEFIKIIFRYTFYDNNFILRLIRHSKQSIPLSKVELNNMIEEQFSHIFIENSWYMKAIEREKYNNIGIFIKNDHNYVDSEEILKNGKINENEKEKESKVFGLFNNYDAKYHINKKYDFVKKLQSNQLNFEMNKDVISENIISDIDIVRENVKCIITEGNKEQLSHYLMENKIKITELNTEDFDVLLFAIEYTGISDRDMAIILYITGFYVDSIDTRIEGNRTFIIPAIPVLRKNKFKTADIYIIKKRDLFFKFV